MSLVADSTLAGIRERTDIVELVRGYVALKKAGTSWKGLCPFHSEKTPSFHVHGERQFFHCFGCQESGDALAFYMRVEGRTFPEAVRDLGQRCGVEVQMGSPEQRRANEQARERTAQLQGLSEAAAAFFEKALWSPSDSSLGRQAIEAQRMLEQRGVDRETAQAFRLGFAPPSWDALTDWLRSTEWSLVDAEQLGLIAARNRGDGHYDRFRNRLMFPVRDTRGNVVAFSGRLLDREDSDAPKYINSPESPLYKKGELLFGCFESRTALRQSRNAVLCEGNFDVVSMHQAGFDTTVAPLGTALTESQCRLLRRYADQVVVLFDGDVAGKKASRAAVPLLQRAELSARLVQLEDGSDPDSHIRERGAESMGHMISQAPEILESIIDEVSRSTEPTASDRAQAIGALAPLLQGVKSPVERQILLERISKRFELNDVSLVRRELRRALLAQPKGSQTHTSRNQDTRPGASTAPGAEPQDPQGTTAGSSTPQAPQAVDMRANRIALEVLGSVLDHPQLARSEEGQSVIPLLGHAVLRDIFVRVPGLADGTVQAVDLCQGLDPQFQRWLSERLTLEKYSLDEAQLILQRGRKHLELEKIQRELPKLTVKIRDAQRMGQMEVARELMEAHVQLSRSAHRWKQG